MAAMISSSSSVYGLGRFGINVRAVAADAVVVDEAPIVASSFSDTMRVVDDRRSSSFIKFCCCSCCRSNFKRAFSLSVNHSPSLNPSSSSSSNNSALNDSQFSTSTPLSSISSSLLLFGNSSSLLPPLAAYNKIDILGRSNINGR